MRETPPAPGTSAGSQASAQTPRPWHSAVRTSCVALASAHTTIERSADAVASHAAPPCPRPPHRNDLNGADAQAQYDMEHNGAQYNTEHNGFAGPLVH